MLVSSLNQRPLSVVRFTCSHINFLIRLQPQSRAVDLVYVFFFSSGHIAWYIADIQELFREEISGTGDH